MDTIGTRTRNTKTRWCFTPVSVITVLAIFTTANAQTGTLSYIKIVEGTSGNGPELGAKTITTDQTLTVHAAGFDANNNYLGDQTVIWSVSGGVGTLTPASGTTTTLDAKTPSAGIITADHATATDDASGLITVTAGAAHHVKILAGVSGNTAEVTTVNLIIGGTLAIHAGSFDADNNYIAEVSVNWSVGNGIGTLNPAAGISTVFTATTAGAGVITATHATLIKDETGVITVSNPTTEVGSHLSETPRDFRLLQNYPNPFHGGISTTRIAYELPVNASVKIAVYNLSGQLMRILFVGRQNAGRYAATWDGKTIDGEPAPSGIYLLRMEAERFVMARKIVVTR